MIKIINFYDYKNNFLEIIKVNDSNVEKTNVQTPIFYKVFVENDGHKYVLITFSYQIFIIQTYINFFEMKELYYSETQDREQEFKIIWDWFYKNYFDNRAIEEI